MSLAKCEVRHTGQIEEQNFGKGAEITQLQSGFCLSDNTWLLQKTMGSYLSKCTCKW